MRRPAFATEVCSFNPMESGFQCAACGGWNSTSVDESVGRRQSYVEDCQVCCKPNLLRIEYDTSAQQFFITAELE
ncbi:MAG TPA: CPXCG motif-containing cysteine-rich protein [Candidatus Sulfotelmatobacter sp.]|nr:CPXCG motif-containing cysteine-rich protein [Candidatus Sulfotelmatobacter sp.]